jgi:hypothetical protein
VLVLLVDAVALTFIALCLLFAAVSVFAMGGAPWFVLWPLLFAASTAGLWIQWLRRRRYTERARAEDA